MSQKEYVSIKLTFWQKLKKLLKTEIICVNRNNLENIYIYKCAYSDQQKDDIRVER